MNIVGIIARSDMTLPDIANILSDGIDRAEAVEFDVSAIAEPTLWTIQLIEAARKQAAARHVAFSLSAPAGPALSDVLRRGGFLTGASAADRSFWFKGEPVQ